MKIITRLISKEVLKTFFFIILILLATSIVGKLLTMIDMVLNKGVSLSALPALLLFSLPSLLIYIVPVAHLLAVLIVFSRLSGDREIIAMKTSGMSVVDLARPVFVYTILPLTLTLILTIFIFPWGSRNLKDYLREIIAGGISIKERTFNDLQGMIVYSDRVSPSGKELSGVFISDEKEGSRIIIAKKGRLVLDKDSKRMALILMDGRMYSEKKGKIREMGFKEYTLSLEIGRAGRGGRSNRELTLSELYRRIERKAEKGESTAPYVIDLHKRFVLPFSVLPFTLLALSLGIHHRKGGGLRGFFLGLIILFCYYLLSTFSEFLGEDEKINPILAVWFSNIVMTVAGSYLFYRTHMESHSKIVTTIRKYIQTLGKNPD